ncbi:unnamed protein product [Scytosiphon promiscuus]
MSSTVVKQEQHEQQEEQQRAPAFSPMRPPKLDLNAGSDYGDLDDENGGGRRRRSRGHSNDGQGQRIGLQRGVSVAMLKEGTNLPSPGLFDRGPQTPDLQRQNSSREQRDPSDVLVPPGAHSIRDWHVERSAVVAETCERLGVGSKSDFFEKPRMVGLAGPGGAGKSTVASMVVARDDVREHFHKGILWLPVGQGAKDRLPELVFELAGMVYETVMRKACRPPRSAGVGVEAEDGAAYIHEVVNESSQTFLVVADDVWEAEVLRELQWAGVWLMERCEFCVMQLAFAGRWRVVRGKSEEEAWRAALDRVVEVQQQNADEGGGEGEGEEKPLAWRVAMLHVGLEELARDNTKVKELYLSLAILPRGLAFHSKVAAVLLYGDDCSAEDLEGTTGMLSTLERMSIVTLEVGGKYRVHEVHADFVWDCVATNKEARDRALRRWRQYFSSVRALSTYSSTWLVKIWDVLAEVGGEGVVRRPFDAALDAMDPSSDKLPKALRRAARFHWRREDRLEAYTKQYQLRLIEESAVETDSLAVAKILHILGMCVYKGGRKAEAEDLYRRALAIFEDRLGPSDLEVAHTSYELGRCFYAVGRTDEAELHLRKALEIERAKLGEHHLDVASTQYHLGVCLYIAGRREEAEESLRPALAIWEEHPEGDSLNVAHALHSLGLCALKTGRTEEAEDLLRQALVVREDLGPDVAKDVASTLHYLGACASETGRTEEAEKLYREALVIREEKLGDRHPDVARTLHGLGVCVDKAGSTEEGKKMLRRALSIKEEELGADHPSAAKTRKAMGVSPPASKAAFASFAVPAAVVGGLVVVATTLLARKNRS